MIFTDRRPSAFLLENVLGLLSHGEGETYKTILETFSELGYCLEWCVLNSADHQIPQSRKRVFIVGYLDLKCAGKIFPLKSGRGKDPQKLIDGSQGQRVYSTDGAAVTQCAGSGGWGGKTGLYFIDMNPDPKLTENARCITARQDSGISNHKGEHSGVFVEEPRAVINPEKEKTRQNGRRVKDPNCGLCKAARKQAAAHYGDNGMRDTDRRNEKISFSLSVQNYRKPHGKRQIRYYRFT